MPEHESIVTRKGQITIPVALRRRLNLNEGDRVTFAFDAQGAPAIVVRPVASVSDRTFGRATRRHGPVDLDDARRQFAESRADEYVRLDAEPCAPNPKDR